MKNVSRRLFLNRVGIGLGTLTGSWILAACGQRVTPLPTVTEEATPVPTAQPLPTDTVAPSPVAAATTQAATATPVPAAPSRVPPTATPLPTRTPVPATATTAAPTGIYPDLVVARGGEPQEMVQRAMKAIGGIERFVRRGNDVIIKPNICNAYHSYEYASTTNPWVVGTLVKLCLDAGARRVRVLDSPFGGGPEEAYVRSGIQEQVKAAGGQMEIMARFKFVKTSLPDAKDLRQCNIYDDILKADVVINVPIAKDHGLARLTLGMKNLMGVITDREAIHRNMGQRLADLTGRIRPALTVVDAVRILTANGPTGGNLDDVKKLDTIIVSPDIVAADTYAATLFGLKPDDLSYIRAGAAMKLGQSDLSKLKIEEIAVGA